MTTTESTSTPDLTSTIDGYFDCWNATDEATRRAAIGQTWAVDATSTDPLADVRGRDDIAAMMAAFHQNYPGHVFRQTGASDTHHDLVRWGWELIDPDGTRVLDGIDVATFDDAGLLTRLAGFFRAELTNQDRVAQ